MSPGLLVLLAVGCGGDEATGDGSGANERLLRDYHGFEEGNAWTYRDDLGPDEAGQDSDTPEENELLRMRFDGDDTTELRRGSRWADAEPVGFFEWDLRDGLAMVAYDLEGESDEGTWRMAGFAPATGDTYTWTDWACVTDTTQEVETFYGVFEDVVRLECEGDTGLPGTWDFAAGVGLIRYESEDGWLVDLVAPY